MVGRLINGLLMFGVYFCAASAAAQAIGIGILYSRGSLARDKWPQYAAVLYGVELPARPDPKSPEAGTSEENLSEPRVKRLTKSAQSYPLLVNRVSAASREKATIDDRHRDLQTRTERYGLVRQSLDDLLTSLEKDAKQSSSVEVQQTLELLAPAQAKEMVLRMLDDKGRTPSEAAADVAGILRTMPPDTLKKMLAEFKTDSERQALHRLLNTVGNLGKSQNKEPGT